MSKILMVLPVAVCAIPTAVEAQGTPTVMLSTISDMDDPQMIRPARPLDGFRDLLKASDFPDDAFEGRNGRAVIFNVVVNADDSVAACTPDRPDGEFGATAARVCEVIRERGRFKHAVDSEGHASQGNVRMIAVLTRFGSGAPAPAPPPPGYRNALPVLKNPELLTLPADPAKFVNPHPNAWLDINDSGKVTRCRIRTSTGTDAGDFTLCRRLMGAHFEPARDPQGKRVGAQSFYVKLEVAS